MQTLLNSPPKGRITATLLALALLSSPLLARSSEPSAATSHLVKAIQELEREVKAGDEHKRKALGLLLRARAELLQARAVAQEQDSQAR